MMTMIIGTTLCSHGSRDDGYYMSVKMTGIYCSFLPKTFISARNNIMLGVNKWVNRIILTITTRAF